MSVAEILLQVLTATNLLTPEITALIAFIKKGKDAGATDEQILAEATTFALDTQQLTAADESPAA